MALQNLGDLYLDQIRDLYSAETQIVEALPKMIEATTHAQLRAGFEHHLDQTREHVRRLEQIAQRLDEDPDGETCDGMKGLLKEGHKTIKKREDSDVLDAALIADAQRVEHYEIAAYGCARTYAEALNRPEDAQLLQRTLDEEGETDRKLTEIALSVVNPDAGAMRSSSARLADVEATATAARKADARAGDGGMRRDVDRGGDAHGTDSIAR
ncbi:MAG TPA: ferritin-like domain-containing protein [Gemmatimonadaceae bacterium]|nr:ferritin-like domain-containing protein [Gemmatimonadaceae bacterium]